MSSLYLVLGAGQVFFTLIFARGIVGIWRVKDVKPFGWFVWWVLLVVALTATLLSLAMTLYFLYSFWSALTLERYYGV